MKMSARLYFRQFEHAAPAVGGAEARGELVYYLNEDAIYNAVDLRPIGFFDKSTYQFITRIDFNDYYESQPVFITVAPAEGGAGNWAIATYDKNLIILRSFSTEEIVNETITSVIPMKLIKPDVCAYLDESDEPVSEKKVSQFNSEILNRLTNCERLTKVCSVQLNKIIPKEETIEVISTEEIPDIIKQLITQSI